MASGITLQKIANELEADSDIINITFGTQSVPLALGGLGIKNARVPVTGIPTETINSIANNALGGYRWNHTTFLGEDIGRFKLQSFFGNQINDLMLFTSNTNNTNVLQFIDLDLDLNGNKIVNGANPDPNSPGDLVNVSYLQQYVADHGGSGGVDTLTGAIVGTRSGTSIATSLNPAVAITDGEQLFGFSTLESTMVFSNTITPSSGQTAVMGVKFNNTYDKSFDIQLLTTSVSNSFPDVVFNVPQAVPAQPTEILTFTYQGSFLGYESRFNGDLRISNNLYTKEIDATGACNFFNINVQGNGSTVSFIDKLNVGHLASLDGNLTLFSAIITNLTVEDQLIVENQVIFSQIPRLNSSSLATFKDITASGSVTVAGGFTADSFALSNGNLVAPIYGGTGVSNNNANTITTGGVVNIGDEFTTQAVFFAQGSVIINGGFSTSDLNGTNNYNLDLRLVGNSSLTLPNFGVVATLQNRLDQFTAPTTVVSMGNQRVINVATPTAGTDAANKTYVDSAFSGAIPNLAVGLFSMCNNSIGTQVTLVDNRQKILTGGTITTFNGGSFIVSTNNRITFTGSSITRLLVSYELTATHNAPPSTQFQTIIYANGQFQNGFSDVSMDQGAMNIDGTNIGTRTFFGEGIASFASGSYLEVWVLGLGDTATFTVQTLKLKAVRC